MQNHRFSGRAVTKEMAGQARLCSSKADHLACTKNLSTEWSAESLAGLCGWLQTLPGSISLLMLCSHAPAVLCSKCDGVSELLTNTPHTVDVVLVPVWQRHVDHVGQASDVDTPGSHVCRNQEAYVARLERLQART